MTSLRPNNLDITVSFGNIPIILIIPFINAFVPLGLMSKPREKKSCTWNTSAKKKNHSLYKYSLQLLHTQVDALLLGIDCIIHSNFPRDINLSQQCCGRRFKRETRWKWHPSVCLQQKKQQKRERDTFEHCNYSALQGVYCLDRNQMEIHINIYYRAFQIFTWKVNFKQLTFFMKSLLSSLYMSLLWLL